MDQKYFEILLKLSEKASKKNEVPVSALIVKDNKIIATAYNRRNKSNFIGDHAEMLVIKKTSAKLKTWHLNECDMYVTLKPCNMCMAAINQARIKNVYYLIDKPDYKKEYEKTEFIETNISTYKEKYAQVLRDFFQKKRDKKRDI